MADKIRDEAMTALKEFYDWHASDTRWTARLDRVRDYIVYLEAYAPIPADEITAEPVPDDPNGTDAAINAESLAQLVDENGQPVEVPQGDIQQAIAEPGVLDYDMMTVAQLRTLAAERNVDLTGLSVKADIIAAIQTNEAVK